MEPLTTYLTPVCFDHIRGRRGDPKWAEKARFFSADQQNQIFVDRFTKNKERWALLGTPDDQGVQLNRGRKGASGGPDSIREFLYRMAGPMDFDLFSQIELWDFGNVKISHHSLSETHHRCQLTVQALAHLGFSVIVLGGGHDLAYPHVSGFVKGMSIRGELGLVNIDPHLDVRPPEEGVYHSGTPFRRLIDEEFINPECFVEFGAQRLRNSTENFEYCRKKGIQVTSYEESRESSLSVPQQVQRLYSDLSQKSKAKGLTIDMDCCHEAEGSSAAPVIGYHAWELTECARVFGSDPEAKYLEIAEVAPVLDPTKRSSRIASELIAVFLCSRYQQVVSNRLKERK